MQMVQSPSKNAALASPKGKKQAVPKVMTFKQSRINYEWLKPEILGCPVKKQEKKIRSSSIIGEEEGHSRKTEFIQFAS